MNDEKTYKLPPGEFASWSDEEYILDECPFCGRENKFTWNIEKNIGRCWVCEKVIKSYRNLIWKVEHDVSEVRWKPRNVKPATINKNNLCNAWDHPKARLFLMGRGINELICRENHIKYLPELGNLYVDISPLSPDLPKLYLWRRLHHDGAWYFPKGSAGKGFYYGWGHEKFLNSGKNVLITEGIFDLLSPRLYNEGIAVLGSNLNDIWFYWFRKHCNKLVLWFDPDKAGNAAVNSISEKCLYHNIPFSVIKSKKPPKAYSRKITADRKFLESVEAEIKHNPSQNIRPYIYKG